MNICFVIDQAFPSLGGAGKTTERFAEGLKERGHKIVFLTSKQNKKEYEEKNKIKIYRKKSLMPPFIEKSYYFPIVSDEEIINIFNKEKIDIVVTTSYSLIGYNTIEVAKKLNIPVVYSMHNQCENILKPLNLEAGFFKWLINEWFRYLCDSSNVVITPSLFSKRLMRLYGVKNKIEVISNGINFLEFDYEKTNNSFIKKYKLEKKRFILGVGRLTKEKNFECLVRGFAKIDFSKKEFKDLFLVIIGGGVLKEELKCLAKDLGVENRVIVCGRVKKDLLKSAYKNALFFVHPSFIELEGMSVMEAIAYKKPLIISNSKQSASKQFVKENGFLFNPEDHNDLSKKIIKLVNNKEMLNKFSRNSYVLSKEYDFNNSLKRFEDVLVNAFNCYSLKDVKFPIISYLVLRFVIFLSKNPKE